MYPPYSCMNLPHQNHIYHHFRKKYIFTWFRLNILCAFSEYLHFSGYIITPVVTYALYDHRFYSRSPIAILHHTLQHILHFTHTSHTYAQNSFQNCLPKNDLPTYVLFYMNITFLSHISWIPNSINLSIMINPACANSLLRGTWQNTY